MQHQDALQPTVEETDASTADDGGTPPGWSSGSMPAKQAVALLGSFWEVLFAHDPEEPVIVQRLGVPDGEYGFDVLDRARAKARAVRSAALARRYASSGAEASRSPLKRVARLLLGRGAMGGRRLLAQSALVEGQASAAARAADGSDGWEPAVRDLPDSVVLPPGLAVQSSVWEVTWDHPIEKGIRIRELRVTEVRASPAHDHEPHDYRIVHRAEDDKGGWTSFGHVGDAHDGRIPDAGLASGALFRTRGAAEAQLRAVASMMLGRAEEALRSIGRGRGRAHGAALGMGNATARALQAVREKTPGTPPVRKGKARRR